MSDQDIVIAGAGHNSLVTATYLAKAGFSVLLIEARNIVGGRPWSGCPRSRPAAI